MRYPRVMRQCPKCRAGFESVQKTFAEIDVCPQCAGVFLDPGEGASLQGTDTEAEFLVKDGRATRLRTSHLSCPSDRHDPVRMEIYGIGPAEARIEIDVCPSCWGVFLDDGEMAALDALEAAEVRTEGGATFAAPPRTSNAERAIADARAKHDRSFFVDFVGDAVRALGATAHDMVTNPGAPRRHPRRKRWF